MVVSRKNIRCPLVKLWRARGKTTKDIALTQARSSKPHPDELGMGYGLFLTDHMFDMNYSPDKGWRNPRKAGEALAPIAIKESITLQNGSVPSAPEDLASHKAEHHCRGLVPRSVGHQHHRFYLILSPVTPYILRRF
jgi:hypothetical protein